MLVCILPAHTCVDFREILPEPCAAAMKALMHSSMPSKSSPKLTGLVATTRYPVHLHGAVHFSMHPQQQIPQSRMLAVHAADPGHYGSNEKVHNLLDLLHEVSPCKLAGFTAVPHPVARSGSGAGSSSGTNALLCARTSSTFPNHTFRHSARL